jgi:hypothetical protein
MKALALLLVCSSFGACTAKGADLPSWQALKLVDGTEYYDAKVTAVETGGIKIMHAAGVARVPEAQLPPNIRSLFRFDPEQAVIEEQERRAKDQAARELAAAVIKAQREREADLAAREALKYGYRTYRIERGLEGGLLAHQHDIRGAVGEAGQTIRRLVEDPKRLRFPAQSMHVKGGTNYAAPFWLDERGAFAEGDLVGGFVAELGTVKIGDRVLRRIVLKPGHTLERRN